MRRAVVGITVLAIALTSLVHLSGSALAADCGSGPCPTLAPPSGQTAVKGGDTVTFGGTVDPSATLVSAGIRALDANGGRLCYIDDESQQPPSNCRDLDVTNDVSLAGGSISGSAVLAAFSDTSTAAVQLVVTVAVGEAQATGASSPIPVEFTQPAITGYFLTAPDTVHVAFSEPVAIPAPYSDDPADWTVAGVPPLSVTGSGADRYLHLAAAEGGNATPQVVYEPRSPASRSYVNAAGWTLAADHTVTQDLAADRVPPADPTFSSIAGKPGPHVAANDPAPSVVLGGLSPGDVGDVYLESGQTPGLQTGQDTLLGEAPADRNGDATVHAASVGPDGTSTLYGVAHDTAACDPNDPASATCANTSGVTTATYTLDTVAPRVKSAGAVASTLVLNFSEPVNGSDLAADWSVTDPNGQAVLVTGVSGSGDSRTLALANAAPKGSTVAYAPTAASTPYADAAGNTLTGFPISAITPPIVDVTTPSATAYTKASTYEVAGTTDPGSTVALYRDTDANGQPDGDAVATTTAGAEGSFIVTAPLLPDATNTFLARATREGFTGGAVSMPAIVQDGTAPHVKVTAPAAGQLAGGGTALTVRWTASDPNLGSAPVDLEVSTDGGATWTGIAHDAANGGSYDWTPPAGVQTSRAEIRVTATDLAGNAASDVSPQFTIDTVPPTMRAVTSDATHLTVTFSEPVTGTLAFDEWTVDGWPVQDVTASGGATFTSVELTTLPPFSQIGPNDHPTVVYAPDGLPGHSAIADVAGNAVPASARSVIAADGIAPTRARLHAYDWLVAGGAEQVHGTAEAGDRVVASRLGRTATFTASVGADGAFTVALGLVRNASNRFELRVQDPSGNLSQAVAFRIDRDDASPRVSDVRLRRTGPSDAVIRWSSVEAHPGSARLAYRVAGRGGWHAVARDARATGPYRWRVPASLRGARVVIRVIETDLLGRTGRATSSEVRA